MPDPTISFYETNAAAFFAETVAVDMEPLYQRFLPLLPDRGHILDAGCGSGRDAAAFLARGFLVTAFDASPAMAALAAAHLGQDVACLGFQQIKWQSAFDGIWACASLLHVAWAELPVVLQRLQQALKPDGIMYASFKYGSGEREHGGRRFTDLDETGLSRLLAEVNGLAQVQTWTTADQRPGREHERWLNALLRRVEGPWASS